MTNNERLIAINEAKEDFEDMADHSQFPIRVMERALDYEDMQYSKEFIMEYIRASYVLI